MRSVYASHEARRQLIQDWRDYVRKVHVRFLLIIISTTYVSNHHKTSMIVQLHM